MKLGDGCSPQVLNDGARGPDDQEAVAQRAERHELARCRRRREHKDIGLLIVDGRYGCRRGDLERHRIAQRGGCRTASHCERDAHPSAELEDAGEVGADDLVHASVSATSAARLATVILGADIHRSSEKP